MNDNCDSCGQISSQYRLFKSKVEINNDTAQTPKWLQICNACWFDKYCQFCDGLVLLDDCTGHDVTIKRGNRFSDDKAFTDGILFEFDSMYKPIND